MVAGCDCKEPGGATEVKNMIRSTMKKGLNDEQITSLLTKNGVLSKSQIGNV